MAIIQSIKNATTILLHIILSWCNKFPLPLVWEEIENEQTVHKPKLKFIYRYVVHCTSVSINLIYIKHVNRF
jgi:hypothetical protein